MEGQTVINVMVGTAGHIDHGKTELVKLLTGCDTDRLKEEKRRGMSIDLGFAPCSLADNANVGIVDVPGHERFIRNMVAGASSIDVVLLVVAADDGVMPQTREHLEVVQLLGVERGLIALTKIDLVDQTRRQRAIEQIRELTRGTFLAGAKIAPVSSVTAEGFDGFYEALSEVVAQTPRRNTQGVFRLPIERVFSVKGYGTVVTGVPASGQVQLGDQLELIRAGSDEQGPSRRLACRVRGLQVFGKDTRCGLAGQCVAVNLAHVGSGEIGRGDALVSEGYFRPTQIVTGELSLLSRVKKPLAWRTPVALHVGTSERQAKAVLLDRKELAGGDSCPVQFLLDGPIVAGPTDRFVIRTHSPRMTIGGGVVVDTGMPRKRRLSESELHGFWARRQGLGDPQATVVQLARQAGGKGIGRDDLQYASELKAEQFGLCLERALGDGTVVAWDEGRMIIHAEALKELEKRLLELLRKEHEAAPKRSAFTVEELQGQLGAAQGPLAIVIESLLAAGRVQGDGWQVSLAEARYELSPAEREGAEAVEKVYQGCGARPPKFEELAAMAGVDEATAELGLKILLERGRLLQISEKFAMHAEVVGRARDVLVNYLREHGQLISAEYKNLIDSERKYAISLLDYFDRFGISIRRGNSRFLGGKPDASLRSLAGVGKARLGGARKKRLRK